MSRRTVRRGVVSWRDGAVQPGPDTLAGEEPLEIRVDGAPLTVTMRTPGDDVDLVLGFLVSEGVIRHRDQVRTAAFCAGGGGEPNSYNILDVTLDTETSAARPARQVLTTSACGLCGRTSIEEVRTRSPYDVAADPVSWSAEQVAALPDTLRTAQKIFDRTGGLHAAGLFGAPDQPPLVVREDVGRHNAVDKVIGWALREDRLPAAGCLLVVSGRASFELVQKAVVAGIPALVAVSAPSSLAAELAEESGLTLVGFARRCSMNVYAGAARLGLG